MRKKIARYEVERLLGGGGMGLVYKARDPRLGRTVAIKTIRAERLGDEPSQMIFKKRFFQEARICAVLQHQHVVAVYDIGEYEGAPFIVMEYIDGQTLNTYLNQRAIAPSQALPLLAQMTSGIQAAHDLGIVHRDLKPGNIMVTPRRSIKILDFGIAKPQGDRLTRTGEFIGTPCYCSPEQIKSEQQDYRSDLFSLAIVVYEMLTGCLPFSGDNTPSILYKIAHEAPDLEASRAAFEERVLDPVFVKAFAKDPDLRYQKASDFFSALEQALATRPGPAVQPVADDWGERETSALTEPQSRPSTIVLKQAERESDQTITDTREDKDTSSESTTETRGQKPPPEELEETQPQKRYSTVAKVLITAVPLTLVVVVALNLPTAEKKSPPADNTNILERKPSAQAPIPDPEIPSSNNDNGLSDPGQTTDTQQAEAASLGTNSARQPTVQEPKRVDPEPERKTETSAGEISPREQIQVQTRPPSMKPQSP